MNNVILCGRLTKDPEIRQTTTTKIASYTLAVRRTRRAPDGSEAADFINCKAFSQGADFAQNYLHKGTKLIVRGRIETGKYTNKDGVTVYTTEVIADEQEFAESKAAAEQQQVQTGTSPTGTDNFVVPDNLEDKGLPFA